MMNKLKQGGMLYLSFPCYDSLYFPRRMGTLNYYDDETHTEIPPKYEDIINLIKIIILKSLLSLKDIDPLYLLALV